MITCNQYMSTAYFIRKTKPRLGNRHPDKALSSLPFVPLGWGRKTR